MSSKWFFRVLWTFNSFLIFFVTIPSVATEAPVSWSMGFLYILTGFAMAVEVWSRTDA